MRPRQRLLLLFCGADIQSSIFSQSRTKSGITCCTLRFMFSKMIWDAFKNEKEQQLVLGLISESLGAGLKGSDFRPAIFSGAATDCGVAGR